MNLNLKIEKLTSYTIDLTTEDHPRPAQFSLDDAAPLDGGVYIAAPSVWRLSLNCRDVGGWTVGKGAGGVWFGGM